MLCRTSGGGHEPSPSAAAAAELRALGAEGASWNRRLWECHKVAEQGATLTTYSLSRPVQLGKIKNLKAQCAAFKEI